MIVRRGIRSKHKTIRERNFEKNTTRKVNIDLPAGKQEKTV